MYALIYSYDYVEKLEWEEPDNLVGRYLYNFLSDHETHPTLYLVDIDAIHSPTVGIRDVRVNGSNVPPVREQLNIFLLVRKAMWYKEWDLLLDSFVGEGTKNVKEKVEEQYETAIKENDIIVGVQLKSLEELTRAHTEAIAASRKNKRGRAEESLADATGANVVVATGNTKAKANTSRKKPKRK